MRVRVPLRAPPNRSRSTRTFGTCWRTTDSGQGCVWPRLVATRPEAPRVAGLCDVWVTTMWDMGGPSVDISKYCESQ